MADLNDLISQANSNQSGTTSKANLLDYADKPQEVEAGQEEVGQDPMLSQQDVQQMSRQGAVSAVEQQIDPGVAGLSQRDQQAITDTGVDPELIFEGNAEKFGKSLVAGTGIVVNDIGNMIDYAAMTILPDEVTKSDTFLKITERLPSFHKWGESMQKWGEIHQSPGLDEFTLDDMFKIEFWATDVAKTLPYMASMIVPGKMGVNVATGLMKAGARSAAKRGMFGSAKRLVKTRSAAATAQAAAKGGSKAVAGAEAALGGEGLMGALATQTAAGEVGLSSMGSGIAAFLGSGGATTAVIGAGLAGDVYNRALDMGLTEEEAQEAAHGTFIDNSKWFALNGLSWGVQFGGLSGRAFKQFNKMRGGAESAKAIQKTFGQRLMQHASRGAAVGTFEGTEEMFQETYEEWIQQKNLAEVQGKDFVSYTDFLTSEENKKTLGVSFAAGFLMGGRGGFMDSVAENGRRITNKRVSIDDDINSYENMSEAQRKVRTNEIIEAAVREDQVDGLNGMLDKLQAGGKISAEERAEYDNIIMEYSKIAAELPFQEKLTEVGQQALFNIKVKEAQSKKSLENLEVLKNKNIAEANNNLEGEALTNELTKIEAQHKMNVDAVNKSIAEGKQSIAKLLAAKKYTSEGKKADTKRLNEIKKFEASEEYNDLNDAQKADLNSEKLNLEQKLKEDSYAIEEADAIADQMTEEEYEQFTKEGAVEKAEKQKQQAEDVVDKVVDKTEETADTVVSKAKSFAGRAVDFVKQKFADVQKGREFRKAMRPFDAQIQELQKQGKTTEEILEAIKPNIELENITDEDITSYINTTTGNVEQEVEQAPEQELDEEVKTTEDERPTTEDTATEEAAESEEQAGEAQTQPSDTKTKEKPEVDEDITFAERVKKTADKIAKDLSKKAYRIKKKATAENIKGLFKEGFGKVPKMKTGVESKQTVLQYYASLNPVLESAIIGAASKKFPNKQLLILREVIDEHGSEVAGMALGSAVQVQSGQDVGIKIMHEYGHVYYGMMKNNPSFKRGVAKIINSKIFRDTKSLYSEELLYNLKGADGQNVQLRGDEIFASAMSNKSMFSEEMQQDLDAFNEAQAANDYETARAVFDKFLNKLQEDGAIEILPDNQQENIIEEAFVTSLAPQMAGQLNVMFDKSNDVVQYEGFLKRLKGRVSKMITPSDAKDILKNVDRKFENMSLEEIGNEIINDISTGVNGGKFKSGKAKYMKFGKLSKQVAPVASIEINKMLLSTENLPFETMVDRVVDNISNELQDPDIVEQIKDEVALRLASEINTRAGNTLDPDGVKSSGVSKVYEEAGYDTAKVEEETDEDSYIDPEDTMEKEEEIGINITSDENARQAAMQNSSSEFMKALMMIANPQGQNRQYEKTNLEAAVFNLAKKHRGNVGAFIKAMNASNDPHIVKALEIMNKYMEPLEVMHVQREFHKNFSNKHMESITNTIIKGDGNIVEAESLASSEESKIKSITNSANKVFFGKSANKVRQDVANRLVAAKQKVDNGGKITTREALMILAPILHMSDSSMYLDMNALVGLRIPVKGKQYNIEQFVENFVKSPLFNKHIKNGQITIKNPHMSSLIENMVVKSRGKNMIKTVSNVNGRKTMTLNMNSHLLNSKETIERMASTEEGRQELLEKYPGNPFIKMVVALGQQGLESEAFKLSIDGGTVSLTGSKSKAVAYQNKTKEDILFGDLESFISSYDKGKPGSSRTYYSQPVSVFSNSKRRYNIQAPMVTTEKQKQKVLEEIKSNGLDKQTYEDGTSVLGVKITGKKGAYKVDLTEQTEALKTFIENNPGVLKDNPLLSQVATVDELGNVVFSKEGLKILEDFNFNSIVNSTYAQKLFVGEHTQAKSQSDFVKRATGAIARHDGSLRGVAIEPLIIKDIESEAGNETDAAAFVLPEDVPFLQDKVGPRMGRVFKFVYYGNDKRGDNANEALENEDSYLKTAVVVLDPEMIGESEVLQNIADKLRARRKKNGYGESLNIAVFESGAKKFPAIHNGEKAIDHDAEFGPDSEAQQQLNEAHMIGDKLVGIDGANMGIQLPMDKDKKTIGVPTQHIGNTNNDLSTEEALQVDEIQALEGEIFDANLEEAVGAMIADNQKSTSESRRAVKEMLGRVVGRNAIRSVSNGTAKMIAASNPDVSLNLPGLQKYFNNAIRSLIKKSSKIITNGTIGIQATSVGRGLKAYTQGTRFNSNGERRKVTLAAEAIVPASLKGKYLARVDVNNNGEKFNSSTALKSFIDNNMISIASSKGGGFRVKGLDRSFETELEAKQFLYGQMAQLEDGSYVILGEEFLGSRIPAHGNQSRVVMEVKGFQHEVKGKDGKFQNNAIQIPAEVNKVLGSDHDGDSIFMNFRYDRPANEKQRKTNEYLRKTIEFYEQPARFEEITADLDIQDEVEARREAINKRFPSRSERQNQNTPLGAAEFFEENVTGSQMVGNVAALNVGLSYLSRYGVNLGFSVSIDGESKNDFNNDYDGEYKENALSFQSAKTLQIVLDNAKNQQATTLGLNPSTIVAGTILPRIGFSASKIDVLLNSEGAKLYTKHAGKKALRDRNFMYTSPAEAAIFELTGDRAQAQKIMEQIRSNPDAPININTDLISDKPAGTNNSKIQNEIEIIKLLHKLESVGQDVYLVNTLLGTHKTVPTNSQETQELLDEINDLFNEDSAVKGSTALTNLKSNPVVRSFQKKLNSLKDIYDKNQLSGTWHANETLTMVKNMVGGDKLFASDGGNMSKIIEDYNLNIISNYAPKISNAIGKYAKTKDGVINPTNLVEELQRRQGEMNADLDNRNEFLHAISITKHEGFKDPKTGEQVTEDRFSIRINKDYINEHTRPAEIEKIKSDFSKLPIDMQEKLIAADAILNAGGQATSSVSLLFDNKTLVAISKSIDSKHQEILNETTGALADPKVVAEALIIENPDIVPTAQRVYKDKNGKKKALFPKAISRIGKGAQEMRLNAITADIQRTALRTNSPHYIKIQDGNNLFIYKWKPAPADKFDSKNWLGTSKKFGKYTLVGKTKKGAKTNISNLTKMERAAKSRAAVSALINADKTIPQSAKMKFNNTRTGAEQGFTDNYQMFTYDEYLTDKGFTPTEVRKNRSLKETLDKLYEQYQANFNLAQEFDKNIVQTGKLSKISEGRLTDYALLFQKLDPSAISGTHKAVVLELAKRAAEDQKASRNGIEWTDKGDISWLHAWFGSNNIPGNRPEIQNLVRQMEKEYDKFMDENIKFQKELDRLTKNLIRDKLGKGDTISGKAWSFARWFAGGLSEEQNSQVYGNMYDKKVSYIKGKPVPELKLKSKTDFLRTNPSKAEREFYNFFVQTTNKYGKITKSALGERFKEGYIPHLQTSLKESFKQRGLFGLYDYMLQGTGDIDNVRVKGVDPVSGKTVTMPFHEWKYVFYTEKGIKGISKKKQFKAVASLDVIRKRAEKLAKSGKHEDGKPISRTEQEIHGMLGTNLMSRFTKSRGVKAAMFGSQDLGRALSQYVNTTLFTYGNENFSGFKAMAPLLDGVIQYNKERKNKNAVTYLENVWKKGFYNLGESQTGIGRLADSAIHKLIKLTRIRYLSLGFGGGFGNLVVGKYNEFRSKGGKNFVRGENRYWGQRKKSWAIIRDHLNPESFAYDLIQGNNSSGLDSILMAPYIGSEHYIQGAGLVSQFTEQEWTRISDEGVVPADLKDRVDLYVDNVVRQQGYGYSKIDQIGIATYSWGKAIMQFKKWMPTAITERFQKETVDRFGELRAGSNATAFAFGIDFTRKLMAGEQSMKDFRKAFKGLPEHKQEAVKTFFRGIQVMGALTAMSMIFGESDDDELRGLANWADDSVEDINFLLDPRRIKRAAEPASWSLVESGSTMAVGMATMDQRRFVGGLRGVSWTAAQVLSETRN